MESSPKPLADRVALVTGASRGIGYATALKLADLGAHVIAVARSAPNLVKLERAIAERGGSARCAPLDLCSEEAIAALAQEVGERHGRLDILFGNAGAPGPNLSVEQVSVADFKSVFAINLVANWQLLRNFDALLKKSDGARAVFMSSSSVRQARATRGVYAASKAALESLIRAYAEANFGTPLRLNLFNPGPVRTEMRAAVAPEENPAELVTPEQCAAELVELFLPGVTQTGQFYDYPAHSFVPYPRPSRTPPDVRNLTSHPETTPASFRQ